MTYPFPGMNPWLESPLIWRDLHHRLISAIADFLAPRLRPRYFVAVETHTYITRAPDVPPALRYPDVMVVKRLREAPSVLATSVAEFAPYVKVDLPRHDPIEEGYLEVRLVPTGEVVTVIKLLSHTNKQSGPERKHYIEKRESLLDSHLHFVEIDLLRAGPPMPYSERAADAHYRLFIRRREEPRQARLYPFSVREPIPLFPLPLLPDAEEPPVALSKLLAEVYERAGYDLVIHYDQPPDLPLTEADAAWAAELLSAMMK